MFAFGLNLSAQTPTTFTTNNLKVMDTLTSINVVNAHEIVASKTITAEKDIVVKKDVLVNGALTVTNTATFKNIINADQGLNFGNNIGLKFLGTNSSNQSFLQIGKIPGVPVVIPNNPICPAPQTNQYWLQNYGGYISNAINGNVNASLSLFTADWNGSGYIETSGTDQNNQTINALFLNYFCGRDIGLCLNTTLANGGGKVKVGNFLSATKHIEIGDPTYGINDNANIALEINANAGIGSKVNCLSNGNLPAYITSKNNAITSTIFGDGHFWQNTSLTNQKMLRVYDGAASTNLQDKFVVMGDGRTEINTAIIPNSTKVFNIYNGTNTGASQNKFSVFENGKTIIGDEFPTSSNYMLTVNGKIGAREIKVSIQNPWPDYVFNKTYNLQSLEGVEKYIKQNQHLPNIPSAKELNKDVLGLDLAKMQGLQMEKIEEIYLHLIELNKQIKELKKENEELKKQIK